MEKLAEQPTEERRRSFDALASVNMFRYDLERFGQVLPETRERVCDEELSYLAEGIDRASRTTFALRREGEDLVYFDRGQWRPYTGMLLTGREVAKQEAEKDPRRAFLAEWAERDLYHGYQMRKLCPGDQYAWCSIYPYDIEQRYGVEFLRQCGLQPDRKMGFLYVALCNEDGDVILESQTIDNSDPEAFAAALEGAAEDSKADMDALVELYDGHMYEKYGEWLHAGRREADVQENVWQLLQGNRDLIEYFLTGLERLAASQLENLEEATKRHVYGVWAAFKKRIDGETLVVAPQDATYRYRLAIEVEQAFRQFAAEGRVLTGCGGAISVLMGEQNILDASAGDVFSAIFSEGGGVGSDKYGSLKFNCPACKRTNTRPRGKLIPNCLHCKADVRC